MVTKYQNSTRQRRRILKQELTKMVMSEEQDPDTFINEVYGLRDELLYVGEVFNDGSILDIEVEGLTDKYLQIKYRWCLHTRPSCDNNAQHIRK